MALVTMMMMEPSKTVQEMAKPFCRRTNKWPRLKTQSTGLCDLEKLLLLQKHSADTQMNKGKHWTQSETILLKFLNFPAALDRNPFSNLYLRKRDWYGDHPSRACLAMRFTAKNGDTPGAGKFLENWFFTGKMGHKGQKTPKSVRKHVSWAVGLVRNLFRSLLWPCESLSSRSFFV